MVLITPYRPPVAPVPQVTPHVVGATTGLVEAQPSNAAIGGSSASRTTVLEGSFGNSPFYDDDLPWLNGPSSPRKGFSWNSSVMSEVFTTMNGQDAVAITWEAGALPSDRWGGDIDLPGTNIGDHAWFTMDIMFSDPFSAGTSNYGGKLPGLVGVKKPPTCNGNLACDDGWYARRMWNGQKSSYSGADVLPGHHYIYHMDKTGLCGDRDNFDNWPNTGWTLGVPHTMVEEVQINSAFNAFDGICRTWIDDVLVAERTNLRMYCGSEANRAGALIGQINWLEFYGGSGSSWSPTFDSTITFGYFKVEVPA